MDSQGMYFFITLKRNAIDFTSFKQLNDTYNKIFDRVQTQHKCVELDTRKRLHIHAIVWFKNCPYWKNYQKKGWTVYFRKIDPDTLYIVRKYIDKNNNYEYQHGMEIMSFGHYHNMFDLRED